MPVFPGVDGAMHSVDFRTEKKAAKTSGLRLIRIYDVRHAFASDCVIEGGDFVSLLKILGHSTYDVVPKTIFLGQFSLKGQ